MDVIIITIKTLSLGAVNGPIWLQAFYILCEGVQYKLLTDYGKLRVYIVILEQ